LRGSRKGFTLIEILVVIAILATLASAVMMTLHKKPDEARVAKTKSDISSLEQALEVFRLDMQRYPTDEEGLQALVVAPDSEDVDRWKGPYIKRMENDPWGTPYVYAIPGEHNPESFDLMSYGGNREEGGEGEFDTDLGNWQELEEEE